MRRLLAALTAAALFASPPACLAATSLVSPIQAYVPVITALTSWSSSTSVNTTQSLYAPTSNAAPPAVLVQIDTDSGTFTAGKINFQVTYDGTNWANVSAVQALDPTSTTLAQITLPYTLTASTQKPFLILPHGAQGLRLILSTAITGTGTITTTSSSTVLPLLNVLQLDPSTLTLAQGSTTANQNGDLVMGAVTTTAPTYTTGQTNPVSLDTSGNLRVTFPDVCSGAKSVKPFSNAASSSNLLLVTGTTGKKLYVCAINVGPVAAAVNVALVEGTTTTNPCDTGTAGVITGATAATGWNFGANGGLTYGNGTGTVGITATAADNVCLFFSAAVQVSGAMSYVVQ